MNQETDSNSLKIPLRLVDASAGSGPFTKLAVVFYAKRNQGPALASGGLTFWLTIQNGASVPLKVQSPLETMQISLLDGKGWPVRLPQGSPPRSEINVKGHFQVVLPFQVFELKDTASGKDLRSLADDLHWTLPPQDTLRIGIRIDRIVPGRDPEPRTNPVPIPEDAYKLKLVVLMISASSEPAHRVFNLDYVDLRLGEQR